MRALRAAPKPAIVVLNSVGQEPLRNCHVGDVMGTLFHRMGAVAAVADAGVRDLAGIAERAPGLQIFAAGTVVSHGDYNLVEVGPTVAVCGITVSTGDLLHGDANGLVSIPHAVAVRLPAAAAKVLKAEAAIVDYIQSPAFDPKPWPSALARIGTNPHVDQCPHGGCQCGAMRYAIAPAAGEAEAPRCRVCAGALLPLPDVPARRR